MSTAPVKDAANKVPPDEKFWKRYSPHGEAPMSVAGSFAAHAIGVGGLILVAVYLASLFVKPTHSLPVEPVRMVGGGGGDPNAVGKGEGGTGPRKAENVGEDQVDLPEAIRPEARRPELTPAEKAKVVENLDPDATRFIQDSTSESTKTFARLNEGIRKHLNDGLKRDKGEGGDGKGGGKGSGDGKGVGPGKGDGKLKLNDREKRMLRWHMRFTANSGEEYLQQLKGLGAILAFPLGDEGDPAFHVVRDLRPGGKAEVEDVREMKRIYWIDDKPKSVLDIMAALRLQLPGQPSRFVAFMPEALEKKLFDMERRYVERVLRRPFIESQINETNFRCVPAGNGYQPELERVSMR